MELVHLVQAEIDLRDYPDYAACERANAYPGPSLCEYYAARGIRCAVPLGYAASVAYFYLYHRPRLSFADRALAKLHHVFYPSAGYTTPIGAVLGIVYGLRDCQQGLTAEGLQATTRREKAEAMMAARQLVQRRDVAVEVLRHEQSWASKALVALHVQADPVQAELARLGLSDADVSWERLLVPHGVLWTAMHSVVHDAARYKDYSGPVVAPAESTGTSPASSAVPVSPSTHAARFTKPQTDALVSRIATLRCSAEEDRWMCSAGRFSAYGIFTMLLAWNSGNALFRLSMGLGLGVTVGAVVSATRLDEMFVHM